MKYRQCRECGSLYPDFLDEESWQAFQWWERTSTTATTVKAEWNFSAAKEETP